MELYANIARRFGELKTEGSQTSAVVAVLMDACRNTIYKVIRMNSTSAALTADVFVPRES